MSDLKDCKNNAMDDNDFLSNSEYMGYCLRQKVKKILLGLGIVCVLTFIAFRIIYGG